jgi:glycopeptide antibiotics resistance protein
VTFKDFRDYLADFAWFWPGIAISIVVGVAFSPTLARVLKIRRLLALLLILSFGLIVSATLTPSREALRFGAVGSGSCDLTRIGIAPIADIFGFGDPTFNILLYVPLGVAIGLLPTNRRKVGFILAACVMPVVIELIQMQAIVLDRACQSSDIADNLTGLVVGLVIGLVVGRAVGWTQD